MRYALALFFVLAVSLLAAPPPASAQCTHTLDWSFDSEIAAEWAGTGVSWDGSAGRAAPGRMVLDGTTTTTTLLTAEEILTLLEIDTSYEIQADDVSLTAWSLELDEAGNNHRTRQVINTSVETLNFWNADDGSWYYGWINNNDGGGLLLSIGVGSYVETSGTDVYFDDITLTIPCANIAPAVTPTPTATPTLTPTPTATPIAGLLTPIPTPTPGDGVDVINSGGGFTNTMVLPPPVDIPEYTGLGLDLDFLWDWDVLNSFVSIVRTYPVLLERFSFTPVLVALGAILIVFRALTGIRNYRHQQQLVSQLSPEDREQIDRSIAQSEAQRALQEQRAAYRRTRRR